MTLYIGTLTVNNLKYLKQTVESIVTSHYHEILLVDNGSEDETRSWVASSGYQNILNPENYGVSRGWNQIIHWGMEHADCELILILNNDIVLHPTSIDSMMQAVREEGKLGISGINIGNDPIMFDTFIKPEERFIPNMNFSCFGLTPGCIRRIGLFDENFKLAYYEDNDYHHRMNLDGVPNSCDRWAPFTHYGSRTIREGGVDHEPYFSDNRRYFHQKWGFVP